MRQLAAILALAVLATPASAATSFQLSLDITGDAERKLARYDCEGADAIEVEYINAAPNFLALLPVEGETYIFTLVVAASGARYAASNYVWWTKGPDADLYDVSQGEDAPAILHCSEHIQTP